MTARALAATLATLATLAALPACAGGAYSLGYNASLGSAMAPPTTAKGATTSIRYKEYAGPLGKFLLLLMTAPQKPTGTTRIVSSETTCYSTYCETVTSYEYTPPTEAEMKNWEKRASEWGSTVAPAILSGAMAVEVVIDVASQDLGGDTSGGAFYMNGREQIRSLLFFQGMSLSVGFGFARYTMHGRERQVLVDSGSSLQLMTVAEDIRYSYVGTPVRLTGLITPTLGLYGQFDVNWQPFFAGVMESREQPQIVRAGLSWWLPFVYLNGEASADGFRTDSLTFSLEAGVAF